MNAKYFYIVDHYVPFPSSEYGGIWNVIAENDEECYDLIVSKDPEGFDQAYYGNLRENIMKSRFFELNTEHESQVVEQFIT